MIAQLRSMWMFLIAGATLLLGGLTAASAFSGMFGGPTVHYPEVPTVFYPWLWLDLHIEEIINATTLVAVTLLGVWIFQLLARHRPAAWNWLAVGMAFTGAGLAFLAVLPHIAGGAREADTAQLGGRVYRLLDIYPGAVRLLECHGFGMLCRPYDLPHIDPTIRGDRVELIADPAAETLTIKIARRIVATFHVEPMPLGPRPTPTAIVAPPPETLTPAASTPAANGTLQAAALVRLHPQEHIFSLAFSPDGRLLAGAGKDTVRIWDAHTGDELLQVSAPTQGIPSVVFSPDSRLLASATMDTIWVIDATTGAVLHTLRAPTQIAGVGLAAFSPDGRRLASQELLGVRLWDPDGGVEVGVLTETDGGLAFSADGRVLAIQSTDNVMRLWDTTMDAHISTLTGGPTGFVTSAAVSPEGRLLATAGLSPGISLWEVVGGSWLLTIEGPMDFVYSLAFSPDSRWLASGHEGGVVQLWEVPTGEQIQLLAAGADRISSVAISPDGQTLASASADMTVMLWAVRD